VLWLDAAQGVTLDGSNNVSAWADQSTSGWDGAQSDEDARPAFTSSWTNSLPALTFDGTDDFMDFSSTAGAIAQNVGAISIAFVWQLTSTVAWQQSIMGITINGDTDTPRIECFGRWGGNPAIAAIPNDVGAYDQTYGDNTTTNPQIVIYVCDFANTNGYVYRNGATNVVSSETDFCTYATVTANSTSDNVCIGDFSTTTSRPITGHIGEVAVFQQALSEGDRGTLMSFWSSKYNISIS